MGADVIRRNICARFSICSSYEK